MEYYSSDSSETDDDLPSTHRNRYVRDARVAGNGRQATAGSTSFPIRHNNDLETEIYEIERGAYYHVLRAFIAQSDAITWDNMENLLPNLRKELRVSDEEHRELLSMVNNDHTIRRIREWRKANGIQSVRTPTFSAPRKKQKTEWSTLHPPMQTLSSALERGPPKRAYVRRGRKRKAMSHLPKTHGGRPLYANNGSTFAASEPTDVASLDQLIGRKVWTWWPEHQKFYEAIIKDFKEGRHALVYDINTPNESWEWIDLKDISPQDIRWDGEDPGISQTGYKTGRGRGSKKPSGCRGAVSGDERGRGTFKDLTEKDLLTQNGIVRKGSSKIELLHTDTLIKQVEEVCSASHPDATLVEQAKKILKEHEKALIEAIARLEVPSELLHTDTLLKQVERALSGSQPDATVVENAKKALKEHEQALIEAITLLEVPSDGESDEEQHPFSQGHLMGEDVDVNANIMNDEMQGAGRSQMV